MVSCSSVACGRVTQCSCRLCCAPAPPLPLTHIIVTESLRRCMRHTPVPPSSTATSPSTTSASSSCGCCTTVGAAAGQAVHSRRRPCTARPSCPLDGRRTPNTPARRCGGCKGGTARGLLNCLLCASRSCARLPSRTAEGAPGCRCEMLAYRILYQSVHAKHGEMLQLLNTLKKITPEVRCCGAAALPPSRSRTPQPQPTSGAPSACRWAVPPRLACQLARAAGRAEC